MKQLTQRDRRVLLVGAVVLGAIVLVKFAAMPWLDHWSAVRDQIKTQKAMLTQLNRQFQRLDAAHALLQRDYGPALQEPLQDVEETSIRFNKTVQDVLQAGGIQAETIAVQSVRPLRDVPGVALVSFQIRGKCQIASLAKALHQMRTSEQLIIVDQINARPPDKNKPAELEITLILSTPALEDSRG